MRTERKFDDDFIREVQQMHKRKYPITDIAKKYNISTYMVRRLINTAVLEVETEEQKEETYIEQNQKIKEIISNYRLIFSVLREIDNLIKSVVPLFEEIGVYNKKQVDILHKLELAKNEAELIEVSKELYTLRQDRRLAKVKYMLANRLQNNFKHYKIHTDMFLEIESSVEELIKVIENPKYTPRFETIEEPEELDEWQKQIKEITNNETM